MKINLFNIIQSATIFSALDEKTIKALLPSFQKIYLHKNNILFKQGKLDLYLYIVVSGKLSASLKTGKEKKLIYFILPGDTIGEPGVLSFEPRTMTVRAMQPSILLRLSSDVFHQLILKHPSIAPKIIEVFLYRHRVILDKLTHTKLKMKHIVLISANKTIFLKEFKKQFTSFIQKSNTIKIFSDRDENIEHSIDYLNKAMKENKNLRIIYVLESTESSLARIAFQNADMIYIVAKMTKNPMISRAVRKKIIDFQTLYNVKPDLVLLHESKGEPLFSNKWSSTLSFGLHHHVRFDQNEDWTRLLRFFQDKAVGLVLGGGGLRGWAHLGVIKALSESGIAIDMLGGTSAGAIVAAYYALYQTYLDPEKKLDNLADAVRQSVSFKNMTWPSVSFFNAKDYTNSLKTMFNGKKMEDLLLPCFCIATNLSNNTQKIYRTGALWKVIRSSTSVPAIFPPVVTKGKMYIDGGILNNLPVDVMKKLMNDRGTIIAVELTHREEDAMEYDFSPILMFWKLLLFKMHLSQENYRFPHFIDYFLKSLLAGASAKQKENSLLADVLITPDLSQFSLLNVKDSEQAQLFDMGYQAALKVIRKSHLR